MEVPMMSSMATCVHNGIIYFGGGKNQNWSKVTDFYSLDVEKKTVTKLASMLTARTTHQLVVINDYIYVYGGFDDSGNGILSIDKYDIVNDQWSLLTLAPGSMSKTWPQSIGMLNGRFYVSVFHTPSTFKIMQKGYYFDLNTCEWSDAPVINERARYCPTCTLAFPRSILNMNKSCVSIRRASDATNKAFSISLNDSSFQDR
jgi:N-acetylneuraminic acid mutarotase